MRKSTPFMHGVGIVLGIAMWGGLNPRIETLAIGTPCPTLKTVLRLPEVLEVSPPERVRRIKTMLAKRGGQATKPE
jgi:hypothetical protein